MNTTSIVILISLASLALGLIAYQQYEKRKNK